MALRPTGNSKGEQPLPFCDWEDKGLFDATLELHVNQVSGGMLPPSPSRTSVILFKRFSYASYVSLYGS